MHGQYFDHAFPRHYHDTFVVRVAVEGLNECELGGVPQTIEPGDVLFLHPGEVHTGRSADGRAIEYRAFYPLAEVMRNMFPVGVPPRFARNIVRDTLLAGRLETAHQEALDHPSEASRSLVLAALNEAVLRNGLFELDGNKGGGPSSE